MFCRADADYLRIKRSPELTGDEKIKATRKMSSVCDRLIPDDVERYEDCSMQCDCYTSVIQRVVIPTYG